MNFITWIYLYIFMNIYINASEVRVIYDKKLKINENKETIIL